MDVIVYIAVIVGVTYLIHLYSKNKNYSNKKASIIQTSTIIILLIAGYSVEEIGTKTYGDTIGSYFEKYEYDAKYYVNVFDNAKTTKNYRLPADISRYEGKYRINYAYWPNGGSLSFENRGWDYHLSVGEKVEIKDDDDKTWYIELTKEKAE